MGRDRGLLTDSRPSGPLPSVMRALPFCWAGRRARSKKKPSRVWQQQMRDGWQRSGDIDRYSMERLSPFA